MNSKIRLKFTSGLFTYSSDCCLLLEMTPSFFPLIISLHEIGLTHNSSLLSGNPSGSPPSLLYTAVRHANNIARARRRENKRVLQERARLYEEKIQKQMADIESHRLDAYRANDWETLPSPNYGNTNTGINTNGDHNENNNAPSTVPFVKPLNEPYPNAPFNEARPESLLIWNDFQERYELRDKRILSEKTKQILLSMNRRFPLIWTKKQLSKTFGLTKENIDFIFWENEMRSKYKIPFDLDTIKLLEAYCGTDDIVENKAYTLLAYSDVNGDPFYTSGKATQCSPLIVHEDEMDEHLYSWQKKQKYNYNKPNLKQDQYEIIPTNGSGSGKTLINEKKIPFDMRHSYMIVDTTDSKLSMLNNEPINVKIRECNGEMRWATMEEVNFAYMKEFPKPDTPYNRIRNGYGRLYYRTQQGNIFPKRKFPRRPYMDHQYQEHHWLGGGLVVSRAWPKRLTKRPNGRKRPKEPGQR